MIFRLKINMEHLSDIKDIISTRVLSCKHSVAIVQCVYCFFTCTWIKLIVLMDYYLCIFLINVMDFQRNH